MIVSSERFCLLSCQRNSTIAPFNSTLLLRGNSLVCCSPAKFFVSLTHIWQSKYFVVFAFYFFRINSSNTFYRLTCLLGVFYVGKAESAITAQPPLDFIAKRRICIAVAPELFGATLWAYWAGEGAMLLTFGSAFRVVRIGFRFLMHHSYLKVHWQVPSSLVQSFLKTACCCSKPAYLLSFFCSGANFCSILLSAAGAIRSFSEEFLELECSCINLVNAFSVKPGIFGNAPRPRSKTMYSESTPSFTSISANSFGSVDVYWIDPSRLCSLIILCLTIFGMLI